MACMGHGAPEGQVSDCSPGEVRSLPESSSGQKPAEPGVATAAGDHPAPGVDRPTRSERGEDRIGSAQTSESAYSLKDIQMSGDMVHFKRSFVIY